MPADFKARSSIVILFVLREVWVSRFACSLFFVPVFCFVGCATTDKRADSRDAVSPAVKAKPSVRDLIISNSVSGQASDPSACSDNSDCQLGYCIEGACRPCRKDDDCDGQVCDQGLCRPSMEDVCHAECVGDCSDGITEEACELKCDKECDS